MEVRQTVGELLGKSASVVGGVATALSFDQILGLAIGLGGLSATWWLTIMRNRREAQRLAMVEEEHRVRMEMARRGVPIEDDKGEEAV